MVVLQQATKSSGRKMEVEMDRPQKYQKSRKSNGEMVEMQVDKMKCRPTWQRERTKASRELCLDKIRESFCRQKVKQTKLKNIYKHRESEKTKSQKDKTVMNGRLYCDVKVLQNIICQTAKERLMLERHLVKAAEVVHRTSEVDVTQFKFLKQNNERLKQELERLQDADVRLGEKELELQQLREELRNRQEICNNLKQQLHATVEKQEEAEKHSLDLQQQLEELLPVNAECHQLRESLVTVEDRYNFAKSELNSLQGKVNNLETLVKHMRDAADKRKELEKQHADAVAELQKRQEEVRSLHTTSKTEKRQALETIQSLESKVRELQKKCELQNVLHEELVLEMTALRRSQSKHAWRTQRSHSADMPNETSSRLDEEMGLYLVGSDTIFSANKSQTLSSSLPVLDTILSPNLCKSYEPFTSAPVVVACSPGLTKAVPPVGNRSVSPVTLNVTMPSNSSCSSKNTSFEIDRIMARIEQDNRILVELEKSRATVGSPVSTANLERLRAQLEDDQKGDTTNRPNMKTSVSRKELDTLMAKLEQDNKILAELDKKRATIGTSSFNAQSLFTGSRRPYSATPPGSRSSTPLTGTSSITAAPGTTPHGTNSYSSTLPTLPAGAPYSSSGPTSRRAEDDIYSDIDYIDLPHRGYCKVFISRYSYDPLKQSPNENPEAELRLNAGDYVLIFGLMDEDGFFSGELLDGKKGLVPSNFVEKLTGEDLFEFQSQVLYGNRDSDDSSASFTYPDGENGEEMVSKITLEDYHRMNDYIDLEDIEELDEDDLSDLEREEGPVPPPQRLILERQLNKSILIGWMPPDAPRGSVEAYHVYVDGVPKATIRASEKTRSLVEGADSNQPHRISVRSVGPTGRHSRDAACTIVIGKDIPLAPSCVKASHVTSTSAVISWLPSNSNFQHVVAINSVEVKTLKPGGFRHTTTGLAPNTTYKVSVRARPARLFINHENPRKLGMLTTTLEFRTHPKGWLPDPPVDVQVEPGPQDGTLLVTWLPVTINTKGTSNGAPVTGYVVYTGDRKVGEIDSPTGDHALLDMNYLPPLKKRTLTVRTKSGENLSSESMPCIIPVELLKGVAATMGSRVEDLVEEGIRSELSDIAEETEEDLIRNAERAEKRSHQQKNARSGVRDQDRRTDKNLDRRLDYVDDRYSDHRRDRRDDNRIDKRDDYRSDRRDDIRSDRRDIRTDDRRHNDLRDDHHDSRRYDHDRRDYYSQDRRDVDPTRTSKHYPHSSPDHRPHGGRLSPTGINREHSPRDRSYGSRGINDGPVNRRLNNLGIERKNSAGQVIIEPEENLSDKEIYPQSQHIIPAIEITRDSEVSNLEEDYLRSGRRGYHSEGRSNNPSQYYPNDRSRNPHPVSPTPPTRRYRDPENSYYGQRGQSRGVRDDYYGNGYHRRSSPRTRVPGADNRARLFMALYDYDPQTMSPNPDAAEDELCFQEGQIIKVYGEKDPDGFFRGEINGRFGYIPYNMVTEIQMDDEEAAKHLINENVSSRQPHSGDPGDPWSTLPVRKLVAMYDYDPQELSPNVDAEMELAFKTGDVIYVYGGVDEDGFYMGELGGVRGLVPSNFLTEAPPDFRDPKSDRLGPPPRAGTSSRSYVKEHHHDDAQYSRDSRGAPYTSSGTSKEHVPHDKGRYSERTNDERGQYDRPRGHSSEADRERYNNSSHPGQHW